MENFGFLANCSLNSVVRQGSNHFMLQKQMKQIKKISDLRLDGLCIYCGGEPDTRDHVPSRIIIDNPFPDNLPVVPSCNKCNQDFSKDEEYFACLIECILRGTTDPEKLERKKIIEILTKKPKLRAMINEALIVKNGQTYFSAEEKRIENVILKLARGHATYENSELQLKKPVSISIRPITLTSEDEQIEYFSHDEGLLPEVGSRALQRLLISDETVVNNWVIVQENKYQYSINQGKYGLVIKFLIWNYLACEVIWE